MGPTGPAGVTGASSLVRAAAALRWSRPDLTSTLAGLALESATDADTWMAAAAWLVHGGVALGDGHEAAGDVLDRLERGGEAAARSVGGPAARRLRVELACLARRTGEPAAARALLALGPGDCPPGAVTADGDPELHADVLTEWARCALAGPPDSAGATGAEPDAGGSDAADAALGAAEQAWRTLPCAPGLASVLLLRAVRSRRTGRPDIAAAQAAEGLALVEAPERPGDLDASPHLATALAAEWIAALVDAGRVDEARDLGLATADRLLASARPSRRTAGLRLAVARVAAVTGEPGTVVTALESAARDAAAADVPELESACRSMLGELHEAAGRLDRAIVALRAAMAADRRDRDRSAWVRARLTLWAARSTVPARNEEGAPATGFPVGPAPVARAGAGRRARRRLALEAEGAGASPGAPATEEWPGPGSRPVDTGAEGAGAPATEEWPANEEWPADEGRGRHARPPDTGSGGRPAAAAPAGSDPEGAVTGCGPDDGSPAHRGPATDPGPAPDEGSAADPSPAPDGGPTADPDPAVDQGPGGRGAARPGWTDTDGLGIGDLLAGALAAYRNL